MIQLEIIGENEMISVTAVNNEKLWKVELGPISLTKMKRWRNFTYYGSLAK